MMKCKCGLDFSKYDIDDLFNPGKNEFICPSCGKIYKENQIQSYESLLRYEYLVKMLLKKHKILPDKLYVLRCPQCSAIFTYYYILKSYRNGWNCPRCNFHYGPYSRNGNKDFYDRLNLKYQGIKSKYNKKRGVMGYGSLISE